MVHSGQHEWLKRRGCWKNRAGAISVIGSNILDQSLLAVGGNTEGK